MAQFHHGINLQLVRSLDLTAHKHAWLVSTSILREILQVESFTGTVKFAIQDEVLILEAQQLIWCCQFVATMASLWSKLGHQLSLHSIIFGLLVHFLDSVVISLSLNLLVLHQSINLLLHLVSSLRPQHSVFALGLQCGLGTQLLGSLFGQLLIGGSLIDLAWKFEPGEILGPPIDVERKFESHIGWQSDKVILVVRGVDATHHAVCTQRQTSDLVAILDDVALGHQSGHLEYVDDVKYDNCPSVHIHIQRDLHYEVVLGANGLVEVGG